ncbi:MAG: CapA family protein [Coriobacteriales bacterium]|jgi:poly-gamma-glutamate synthesis protein (capsule biosynthesis protein)|nr:CapA family protein [Coriobacteriales bacterium]
MSARSNNRKTSFLPGILLLALLALLALVFAFLACSDQSAARNCPVPPDLQASLSDTEAPDNNTAATAINIALVGDVNFTDGWAVGVADANGGQVAAAFEPDLLEALTSADVFYANHEFTMSSRGEELNKYYTFRADPARVAYWQQLGVDLVGLGNNHAYDYGEEAFLDMLDILENKGIPYVGAGRNLAEAMAPVYFDFNGYKVAFVAADRSQKGDEVRAAAAGENTPGVLFCFDDTLFVQAVATATQNADFVIAIPHWGTENTTDLEQEQIDLAHKLIDAGADAVVGSHPHILQGMEYYRGKLIAYSLGNFWFNGATTPTLVLSLEIKEGLAAYRIIPALQTEQQVITSGEISAEVIQTMRQLSPGLIIADDGGVSIS